MALAQLNLAHALAPIDDPIMEGFVNNVDRINLLSENSPGFIWRLEVNEDDTTAERIFGTSFILVNMSVWKDRESLFNFVYHSDHVEIFKRKKEWFKKMPKMHMVLWHIADGHIPTISEGKARLDYLREHGETEYAFSFKSNF